MSGFTHDRRSLPSHAFVVVLRTHGRSGRGPSRNVADARSTATSTDLSGMYELMIRQRLSPIGPIGRTALRRRRPMLLWTHSSKNFLVPFELFGLVTPLEKGEQQNVGQSRDEKRDQYLHPSLTRLDTARATEWFRPRHTSGASQSETQAKAALAHLRPSPAPASSSNIGSARSANAAAKKSRQTAKARVDVLSMSLGLPIPNSKLSLDGSCLIVANLRRSPRFPACRHDFEPLRTIEHNRSQRQRGPVRRDG